jgi:hypothetical protein
MFITFSYIYLGFATKARSNVVINYHEDLELFERKNPIDKNEVNYHSDYRPRRTPSAHVSVSCCPTPHEQPLQQPSTRIFLEWENVNHLTGQTFPRRSVICSESLFCIGEIRPDVFLYSGLTATPLLNFKKALTTEISCVIIKEKNVSAFVFHLVNLLFAL